MAEAGPGPGASAEPETLAEWVDRWSEEDGVAFRFEGNTVTYRQLVGRAHAVAAELESLGVGEGDRVAWCGLNRIELFETFFACAVSGAIFLPLNNRLTEGELATQLADSEPTLIVTADGFADVIGRAVTAAGVDPSASVVDVDAAPLGDLGPDSRPVAERPPPPPEAPVLMVYTSGTTGQPKGAMLSHRAIEYTARNSIAHQDIGPDDCVVAPLPTFHVGGLNIQTLPTLRMGGEVLLQRRFDPGGVLELVRSHRPTQALLVPAMLTAVSAHPDFADTDLSCLCGIATGSSVVPAAVMEPFFARGVPVAQVYGATETGPTSAALSYGEARQAFEQSLRLDSCGRASAHSELRVVGDDGAEVPVGADGEVWLRGPNLFSGYWQNEAATAAAFVDGWYRSGDVGRLDAEGYLFISDRKKDMIISGGENVYPAEVEAVLLQHPGIAELAVIGRPDERWGEVPVAYVVASREGVPTVEELGVWCEYRLAKFKRPHDVIVVDALPRTALGKVQKHILRGPDLPQ